VLAAGCFRDARLTVVRGCDLLGYLAMVIGGVLAPSGSIRPATRRRADYARMVVCLWGPVYEEDAARILSLM
jgi:hypothetical protein